MSIGAAIWGAEAIASGISVAVRRPWTAVLSRRSYIDQVQSHPLFREANLVISAGWTVYFGVAALVTWGTSPWVALVFIGPTPFLGWCSFRVGNRYASWTLGRQLGKEGRAMTMEPPSQDALRAMIADRTDEEILALVGQAPGGIAEVLDATVAGMAGALDPDTAIDCVVGYEIDSGSDVFAYRIEVRGHEVETARRAPSDARVVLQLNVPEYLRLIAGFLDGTEAFLSGRMRIRGDVMFAPQIGRMFRTA